jgi:hypothetical protein
MLDPTLIGQALVSTLQNIPTLVAALGNQQSNVVLHQFVYGVELRLAETVYKLVPPKLLIAWDGTKGGNFSGQQIWKHSFRGFGRVANQAGASSPISLSDLWLLIVNGKLTGMNLNIRQVQIYSGVDLMDTPASQIRQDEDGMDFLEFQMVIPEIGDH